MVHSCIILEFGPHSSRTAMRKIMRSMMRSTHHAPPTSCMLYRVRQTMRNKHDRRWSIECHGGDIQLFSNSVHILKLCNYTIFWVRILNLKLFVYRIYCICNYAAELLVLSVAVTEFFVIFQDLHVLKNCYRGIMSICSIS